MLDTTGDDGDPQVKDKLLRTSDRVAAVAAYNPPVDVRPWVVPTSHHYKTFPSVRIDASKTMPAYSPVLAVTLADSPTLIIHDDKDLFVPLEDSDNNFYDAGEGLSGATITATPVVGGTASSTTTWASGGYSLALSSGTDNVTMSGGGLPAPIKYANVAIRFDQRQARRFKRS